MRSSTTSSTRLVGPDSPGNGPAGAYTELPKLFDQNPYHRIQPQKQVQAPTFKQSPLPQPLPLSFAFPSATSSHGAISMPSELSPVTPANQPLSSQSCVDPFGFLQSPVAAPSAKPSDMFGLDLGLGGLGSPAPSSTSSAWSFI